MHSITVCLLLLSAVSVRAASFDVVSVKQAEFPPGAMGDAYFAGLSTGSGTCGHARFQISGNRVQIRFATVCALVSAAYDLPDYRVGGMLNRALPEVAVTVGTIATKMPARLRSDFFEIEVVADSGKVLTEALVREMLRTVLADRFQLKFHRETKETPVYAMVINKGGPKLPPAGDELCRRPASTPGQARPVRIYDCRMTMAKLADSLRADADRPVVDQTDLAGEYKVVLDWETDAAPGLFTAIQELGLKLEPRKMPLEMIVVDSVSRPSVN